MRTALYYPAEFSQTGRDILATDVLNQCQLAHLVSQLDVEADWKTVLSLGEQQRLSIARALLAKPEVLFLDEASSAMDEGLEHAMYQLLRSHLPNTILISVGHRSSLLTFHTQELALLGDGNWQLRDL